MSGRISRRVETIPLQPMYNSFSVRVESQEGLKLVNCRRGHTARGASTGRISRRVETLLLNFREIAVTRGYSRISRRVETLDSTATAHAYRDYL